MWNTGERAGFGGKIKNSFRETCISLRYTGRKTNRQLKPNLGTLRRRPYLKDSGVCIYRQ